MTWPSFAVVIPTVGRPSLADLLGALGRAAGPRPAGVWVVDDRPDPRVALDFPAIGDLVHVLRSGGRGPAAARNAGWRAARGAEWVAFLDDDVLVTPTWLGDLHADLRAADPGTAAVQGRIRVPLPSDRRPTDWERSVAGLEGARHATADLAVRRPALDTVGGFDERFPRAYREDTDLALRLLAAGYRTEQGQRTTVHPVAPADPWMSLRRQRGNRDDALMRRLHGRRWRQHGSAPRGRLGRHLATTAAGVTAVLAGAAGRRALAAGAGAAWLVGTAELSWARIAPGPRTGDEVATMLVTSALLPPLAVAHRLAGALHARRLPGPPPPSPSTAVLFDRDGTLIRDVPYNGDPDRVEPMPGARRSLERLRAAGLRVGVVTNQSGVARGRLTREQVTAVHRRIEELLGPVDVWAVCVHAPGDGCTCRKPAPGLVHAAAERLGVAPGDVVVVGDIGADVWAARRAGARSVLVPTPATRPVEVDEAPVVARDLGHAVDLIVGPGS